MLNKCLCLDSFLPLRRDLLQQDGSRDRGCVLEQEPSWSLKQGLKAASHVIYVNSCASFQLGLGNPCVPWDCVYPNNFTWGWGYVGAVFLSLGNVMVGGSPLPSVPWDYFNSSFISDPQHTALHQGKDQRDCTEWGTAMFLDEQHPGKLVLVGVGLSVHCQLA